MVQSSTQMPMERVSRYDMRHALAWACMLYIAVLFCSHVHVLSASIFALL